MSAVTATRGSLRPHCDNLLWKDMFNNFVNTEMGRGARRHPKTLLVKKRGG